MEELKHTKESKWSFNLEDARRHLLAEIDELSTVMRGHLYVEHVLIEFIQVALPHPGALKIDRLNFPTKLELCIALGAIPVSLSPPVRLLNRLRNNVAHDLECEIPDSFKKELFGSLTPLGKDLVFEDGVNNAPRPIEEVSIGRILLIVLVLLDAARDSYAEWLARRKVAEQNLKDAVDNLRRVRNTSSGPTSEPDS